jgi:F0F1-type ATP synthase assembly protein I
LVRLFSRAVGGYVVESSGKKPESDEPPTTVQVARYSGLGLQLAGSLVLFLLLGQWADKKLGTTPILTLIGALVGASAGFYSLYRNLTRDRDSPKR